MTNDALINGKVIQLSDVEKEAGEKFHKLRKTFAWIDGKLIFNENENDDRDHQHWLLEDYNISVGEFERINRGYMIKERIQLFKGSKFEPIDTNSISVTDFNILLKKHKEIYNSENVMVCNGVIIGNVGEVWEPQISLGVFNT